MEMALADTNTTSGRVGGLGGTEIDRWKEDGTLIIIYEKIKVYV